MEEPKYVMLIPKKFMIGNDIIYKYLNKPEISSLHGNRSPAPA